MSYDVLLNEFFFSVYRQISKLSFTQSPTITKKNIRCPQAKGTFNILNDMSASTNKVKSELVLSMPLFTEIKMKTESRAYT